MNINRWLNEIQKDIELLKQSRRRLTKDGNVVYPETKANIFMKLISSLNNLEIEDVAKIAAFNKTCIVLYLKDVYNDYFSGHLRLSLGILILLAQPRSAIHMATTY